MWLVALEICLELLLGSPKLDQVLRQWIVNSSSFYTQMALQFRQKKTWPYLACICVLASKKDAGTKQIVATLGVCLHEVAK
jgi:hypothetical protein